jgi:hypothetical protein
MTQVDGEWRTGNGARRWAGLASAVLVVAAVAGCSGGGDGPQAAKTSRPRHSASVSATASDSASDSTGAATPSSIPTGAEHDLAALVRHPCRALTDEDTARLSVAIDGSETDLDGASCQWGARGGLVAFTPYASNDQTAGAKYRHLTRKTVDGHRAMLGTHQSGGACTMVVAVGSHQSFRLIVAPFGEDAPGPDAPTVATDFAKAILAHLG